MTTTRVVLIALAVFMVMDLVRFALEPPRERIVPAPTFSIDTPNSERR